MQDTRLNKIKDFYKKYHRLPSYSEMLTLFKLASKNAVFKITKKWQEQGFLQKIGNKFSPTKEFFKLPFLGLVKAGFPTEAVEDMDLLSLDEYLIEKPNSSFLLKVSGDSLTDIGIFPNDLVVIERKTQAENDELILALIDDKWTLKILKKENGKVSLCSANSKYPPFYPQESLQIFGVVKSVIRKYK
ncbi:LexA family protein [Patescibacteria group bacterium]